MKKYMKITLAILLMAALLLSSALTVGASSAAEEVCPHGAWTWVTSQWLHMKKCTWCYTHFDSTAHSINLTTMRCRDCGYQW